MTGHSLTGTRGCRPRAQSGASLCQIGAERIKEGLRKTKKSS